MGNETPVTKYRVTFYPLNATGEPHPVEWLFEKSGAAGDTPNHMAALHKACRLMVQSGRNLANFWYNKTTVEIGTPVMTPNYKWTRI